ncbi:MAG: metal ABC transporter ATP-binding protein [Planctomycetota bacterium]|nr:MAG: metal ABC transporter ATP-binding protein [Planctomycetota bacterium]
MRPLLRPRQGAGVRKAHRRPGGRVPHRAALARAELVRSARHADEALRRGGGDGAVSGGSERALIALRDVTLGYGRRVVVRDASLAVGPGDFVGLVGPNGAGKTTLLRAMLGLLRPKAGRVERAPALRLGYVPQRQVIDPIYPLTVRDIVAMGRYGELGARGRWRPRDEALVTQALEQVGMREHADRAYRELSGGQKQRAVLARALAARPNLLVLDEPTNDMDVRAESEVMALLHALRREHGVAIVMVSHLLQVVANHVETLALLVDGRLEVGPAGDMLRTEVLSALFHHHVEVVRVDGRVAVFTDAPEHEAGALAARREGSS